MRRPPLRLWTLNAHLGPMVSALVDGQLDAEETDRAWQHVLVCPQCRRLVERESWVKRRLAQISGTHGGPGADEPPDSLVGSLLRLDPAAVAWAETQEIEDSGRTRRRAGIALVGAGSVSAAVIGLTALGGLPLGSGGHAPATSIGDSGALPTRAVVTPGGGVHGRLPGWTVGPGDREMAHATAVRPGS